MTRRVRLLVSSHSDARSVMRLLRLPPSRVRLHLRHIIREARGAATNLSGDRRATDKLEPSRPPHSPPGISYREVPGTQPQTFITSHTHNTVRCPHPTVYSAKCLHMSSSSAPCRSRLIRRLSRLTNCAVLRPR